MDNARDLKADSVHFGDDSKSGGLAGNQANKGMLTEAVSVRSWAARAARQRASSTPSSTASRTCFNAKGRVASQGLRHLRAQDPEGPCLQAPRHRQEHRSRRQADDPVQAQQEPDRSDQEGAEGQGRPEEAGPGLPGLSQRTAPASRARLTFGADETKPHGLVRFCVLGGGRESVTSRAATPLAKFRILVRPQTGTSQSLSSRGSSRRRARARRARHRSARRPARPSSAGTARRDRAR